VTVVDPGDMNRVVAATVGTALVMAPADLASRAVPVDPVGRVDMTPEDPVGPVDMILVDPVGRLRAPNPVVRVDPERLVVPNRVEPGNREATDLSLGRALLGRMPMRLGRMPARLVRMPMGRHPTAARPVRTPMLLHPTRADRRTPADHRRDPTTRAVATCQVATRAEATRATRRAEAILRAETRRAEATHPADPTDPRPSSLPASRGRHVTVRTGACNRSRTLVRLSVS
jgi:hypothetical protein